MKLNNKKKASRWSKKDRLTVLVSFSILGLFINNSIGGIVAENGDVPSTMDAGGTSVDPAIYEYNNGYSGILSSMIVGQNTSYNQFAILKQSALSINTYSTKAFGYGASTSNNYLLVTGASTLSLSGGLFLFWISER
ncbi:MAG: hypothetical protein PF692_04680 [Kiritimatiellae bacterium]|jgi:hypothetical protein|nr:hypothetical protein [Kiritimatiellia bacterium]